MQSSLPSIKRQPYTALSLPFADLAPSRYVKQTLFKATDSHLQLPSFKSRFLLLTTLIFQLVSFYSSFLYTVLEEEEPSPQVENMETFDFDVGLYLRRKAHSIHPLNAVLIQEKYLTFCKELTDYFSNPGSVLTRTIFSEIDATMEDTQLDLLHTLYGGSEVRENLGDFKSLWEDDCFYGYEDIDPEIGKRIMLARQDRERASRSGDRTFQCQTEGSRDIHSSSEGAAVNDEEDMDDDAISSFMTDYTFFSQPRNKQSSTLNIAEFLRSISPPQPLAPTRSVTPALRGKSAITSSDGAKKKYWWRRKPTMLKQGSKKEEMSYKDPHANERYGHLIAPDKRASHGGIVDPHAIAVEQTSMRDVPTEMLKEYVRRTLSPSQSDGPNTSRNMTRFPYSAGIGSSNTDDCAIAQRGDAPPYRTLQSVAKDDSESLQKSMDTIDKTFLSRCIPLVDENGHRQNKMNGNPDLSQEEKSKALTNLAEEHDEARGREMSEVMHLAKEFGRARRESPSPTEKKRSPPSNSTMGRLRSAGSKALEWFLAIPDDDDLTSESVYLPYGATDMFPRPLQPHARVSTNEDAAAMVGASPGVSRQRSRNEGRKRSDSSSNMALVEGRGGRNENVQRGSRHRDDMPYNGETPRGGICSEDAQHGSRPRENARDCRICREDSLRTPEPTRRQ
jgi:hypothetical protein